MEFFFLDFDIVYMNPHTHPTSEIRIPCKINTGEKLRTPVSLMNREGHFELYFEDFHLCIPVPHWRKGVQGVAFPFRSIGTYFSYIEFGDGTRLSQTY